MAVKTVTNKEYETKAWELVEKYFRVHGLRYVKSDFDCVNVIQNPEKTAVHIEITKINLYFSIEFTDEKIILELWNPFELKTYHEEYNYKGEQIFFTITRKDGKSWKDNLKGLEDEDSWSMLFFTRFTSPIVANEIINRVDLFHERFAVQSFC